MRVREVLSLGRPLDVEATVAVASQWFRSGVLRKPTFRATDERLPLAEVLSPGRGEAYVGTFPGITIATAAELAIEQSSQLPGRFLEPGGEALTFLYSVDPAAGRFMFATWVGERLVRSLSIGPEGKPTEDIGARRSVELPYWDGQHRPERTGGAAQRFPFAPAELAEAVRHDILGFRLDGDAEVAADDVDPGKVELLRFVR